MKRLRLAISDAAAFDILEQAAWYESQSGENLAIRWQRAVTVSILNAWKDPNIGSPCNFKSEELRDIRRVSIEGFSKHLIFYRVQADELLVLRIVHGARDLEKLF